MAQSDRIVQAGGTVAGLGGALGTGFLIHTLQVSGDFWTWPGWLAVVGTAVGLLIVGLGVKLHEPEQGPKLSQQQSGGEGSRNFQAGRDIRLKGRRDDA